MKKIAAILLSAILLLLSATASAAEIPEETQILMGDVTLDEKINAADARLALRIASKLETADGVNLLSADADGNGKINASDARIILRVASKLSSFTYGFDGNGVPCAIKTLKSGRYLLEASYYDEKTAQSMIITLAQNGNNIYLMSDGLGIDMGTANFSSCGMMINENKIYAILSNDDVSAAMYIPDSMCEQMGMTKEEISAMSDMINAFIPDNIGVPQRGSIDGKEIFYYSYEIENQSCMLFVSANGKLLSLDGETSNGSVETLITFDAVSGDATADLFNLDNYELI